MRETLINLCLVFSDWTGLDSFLGSRDWEKGNNPSDFLNFGNQVVMLRNKSSVPFDQELLLLCPVPLEGAAFAAEKLCGGGGALTSLAP